jgi:hypothetical protein
MNKEARRLLHIESSREFGSNVVPDLRERQGHACNEPRVLYARVIVFRGFGKTRSDVRKCALLAGLRAPMGVPIIPAAITGHNNQGHNENSLRRRSANPELIPQAADAAARGSG